MATTLTDKVFAAILQQPQTSRARGATFPLVGGDELARSSLLPLAPLDTRIPRSKSSFAMRVSASQALVDIEVQVLADALDGLLQQQDNIIPASPTAAEVNAKWVRSVSSAVPPALSCPLSVQTLRCNEPEFALEAFEYAEASVGGTGEDPGSSTAKNGTVGKKWDLLKSRSSTAKPSKKSTRFNYATKAIKEPLTRAIVLTHSAPLIKLALECFSFIMMFMGTKDLNFKSSSPSLTTNTGTMDQQQQRCECARSIISAGLENGDIMCDEIYCQIMKQLNSNKNVEMVKRGWALLAICCSFLRPSSLLESFIRKLIHDTWKQSNTYSNIGNRTSTVLSMSGPEVATESSSSPLSATLSNATNRQLDALRDIMKWSHDRAVDCDDRLNKCFALAARNMGPTDEEVISIENMTPCHLKIVFPDATSKTVLINTFTMAKELTAKFFERFEIATCVENEEINEYGLNVLMKHEQATIPILSDDRLMDIVSLADSIAIQAELMMDWKQRSSAYSIAFERRIWISPLKNLSLPCFDFIFGQVRREFVAGNLISAKELGKAKHDDLYRVIALLLVANPIDRKSESLLKYAPAIIIDTLPKIELSAGISTACMHINTEVESVQEAKNAFVGALSEWQLFGSTVFTFKAPNDARFTEGGMLCVGPKEILLLNSKSRAILIVVGYDELSEYVIEGGDVVIRTDSLLKKRLIRCQTSQGFVIIDTLGIYLERWKRQNARRPKIEGGGGES